MNCLKHGFAGEEIDDCVMCEFEEEDKKPEITGPELSELDKIVQKIVAKKIAEYILTGKISD